MNLANKLTVLRIFLIPVYLIFVLIPSMENHVIALAIFAVASITDFLDGYIARKYNQVPTVGKLADPLADKLLTAAAFISFTYLGMLSPWVVIVIISRELMISVFRAVAASDGKVISASIYGKIKTNLQMAMIIALHLSKSVDFLDKLYITDGLVVLTLVFTIMSAVDYVMKNKEVLYE